MPRKPASDKQLSRRILVLIDRDMTAKTSRVIWQHEKPILEAIFGDGKVADVEPVALNEGYSGKPSPDMLHYNKKQDPILPPSETQGLGFVFIGDPRAEFDRLSAIYGRHPEVNETMCENVYGRFQQGRFEMVLGKPTIEDLPEAQIASLIQSYGGSVPAGADHSALVKLAQDIGIEV